MSTTTKTARRHHHHRGRRNMPRSRSPATSPPPPRSWSGRTPTPSCSCSGSARTAGHRACDHWDARTGGSWRYVHPIERRGVRASTAASTTVREDRLVQTFTYEGFPDSVALETMTFEDLGDGRTRLHIQSLVRQLRGARRDARRAAWTSASTTATPSSTGCSPTAPSDGVDVALSPSRVLGWSHGPADQLRHPRRRRPRPDPGVLRRRARLGARGVRAGGGADDPGRRQAGPLAVGRERVRGRGRADPAR